MAIQLSPKMRTVLSLLLAIVFLSASPPAALAVEDGTNELSMFLHNFKEPFVSKEFAERLGRLVLSEKYPGTKFSDRSAQLIDKADSWEFTLGVTQWPESMKGLAPLSPQKLTVVIRKKDGAILGIK